jgi:hypothetical protein
LELFLCNPLGMDGFAIKISCSPSGIVKVSEGVSKRGKLSPNQAYGFQTLSVPPCQSCQTSTDSPQQESPPEKIKAGWGGLGTKPSMSAKSAKAVRERMVAAELEFGKENCFFITLTLPTSDIRGFDALARYSAYAMDRLNIWMKRFFAAPDLCRISVWEYQKRGALHAHILIASHCIHAINIDEFRKALALQWMAILDSISERFEYDNFIDKNGEIHDRKRFLNYEDLGKRFANVQIVEKSVAAYLSAYLSESNHDKKDFKNKNKLRKKFFPIATWAQWNRGATKLFNKYSFELSKEIYLEHREDWKDIRRIIFGSLEKAEGTSIFFRKNPWWASTCLISKIKGMELIGMMKDISQMIRDSNISPRLFAGLRLESQSKKLAAWEKEGGIHDARLLLFENAKKSENELKTIGNKLAYGLLKLQGMMLKCERQIKEHKVFDSALKNINQLDLIGLANEPQDQGILRF